MSRSKKRERSLMLAVGAVSAVAAGVGYLLYKRFRTSQEYQEEEKETTDDFISLIPGMDPSDPQTGNFIDIGKAGSLHEFVKQSQSTYGDIFCFYWGTQKVVAITSPDLFNQAIKLKLDFRPQLLFNGFKPMVGEHSVQFINGPDYHSRYHDIWFKAFGYPACYNYMDTFIDCCSNQINVYKSKINGPNNNLVLDVVQEMFNLAAISILKISFSKNISIKISELMTKCYFICWGELEKVLIHGEKLNEKLFNKSLKELRDCCETFLNNKDNTENNFVTLCKKNKKLYPTKEHLINEFITNITGGVHTTGYTLAWTLYQLACNPKIQELAYEEIKNSILVDKFSEINKKNISDTHIPYITNILKEVLRCCCIAPWGARVSTTDDVTLRTNGKTYKINKNTPIFLSLGCLLESKKIWGDDFNKFNPDRFNNLTKNQKESFKPFGGVGKRICPGYKLFYVEAKIFLILLLNNFKITLFDQNDKNNIGKKYGLVTSMSKHVKLVFTPRL